MASDAPAADEADDASQKVKAPGRPSRPRPRRNSRRDVFNRLAQDQNPQWQVGDRVLVRDGLSESQWLFGRVVALNPVQVRLKGGRVAFTWREIIADCQSRSPSPSPTSPRESRPSSPCLHPASLQARRRARTLSRRRRRREKEMKEKELEMQQAVLTMLQRAKDDPRIPQAAEQVQQTKARALRDALDEVCREMEEYAEEMKQKAEAARAEKPKAKDAKASSKDAKNAKKKPAEAAKKEAKEAEKNEEDGDQEEPDEDDWNPLKALTRRKPARRPVEFKEASWAKVERLAKGLKGRGVKLRDLRLLTVKEREKLLKEHLGHPSGELPAPSEGNGKKEPPTVPLAAACPTDLDTFIQWLCEQLWLARIQRLSSPERRIGRKRPEQAGRPQKTLSARVGGGFIYETFQAPADFEEEPHSPAAASGPSRRRTTTPQVRNWECDRTISARVGGGFIYKTFQEGDYDNGKDDGDLKRHAEDSPLDRVRKRVEEAAIAESDPKSLARLVQALSNWRMDLDALLCLPQEEFKRVAELLCVNMHGLTKEDVVEKLKKRVWANRTKFAKIKGLSKLAFEPKSQVLTELRKALREAEEQLQRPVTAFQLSGWLAQYQLEYYQLQINNLSLLTVAELRHLGDWMGMPPKKSRAEILEWFQQDLWSERAVRRTPSKAKTQFLRELSTARRRSVDEESAEEAEENQDDEADTATPTLSGILLDDPDFRMEYDMFVPVDT